MEVKKASSNEDFMKCLPVMKELRTHLTPETYLPLIETMKKERYNLLYIEDQGRVVSALGYRYMTTLFDGAMIYIDDLVTGPEARGKGYAGKLFDHLIGIARKESITKIHLDSAHHRYAAHRFYLNKGMNIVYHHFRLEL